MRLVNKVGADDTMSSNLEIRLLSETLSDGETLRIVCPICQGGTEREKSFSITKFEDGECKYQCFRNKCTAAGTLNGVPSLRPASAVKRRRQWAGETTALVEEHELLISERWGITDPPHWYSTDSFGGRVAMSIRSPQYAHRGWVLRSLRSSTQQAKALTYLDEGENALSWYQNGLSKGPGTVLVEDIPSAVRASKYVDAVALLGTKVGPNKALEIATHALRPIYVALDQDAQLEGLRMAQRYTLLWGEVRVILLKKDIKDMKEADVRDLFALDNKNNKRGTDEGKPRTSELPQEPKGMGEDQ